MSVADGSMIVRTGGDGLICLFQQSSPWSFLNDDATYAAHKSRVYGTACFRQRLREKGFATQVSWRDLRMATITRTDTATIMRGRGMRITTPSPTLGERRGWPRALTATLRRRGRTRGTTGTRMGFEVFSIRGLDRIMHITHETRDDETQQNIVLSVLPWAGGCLVWLALPLRRRQPRGRN